MEDSLLFHLGFDPVFLLLGLLIFIIILFVLVISMHFVLSTVAYILNLEISNINCFFKFTLLT